MKTERTYGSLPYQTFLIHGGPGAPGEMASVARELSAGMGVGVVEPFQTRKTISELVAELKDVIERYSDGAVNVVGYSWGAWLSFIFAAHHPHLVRKLILVGSGPFEVQYAANISETRMSRLNDEEKMSANRLESKLVAADANLNSILQQYGNLMSKADSFDPFPTGQDDETEVNLEIFQSVWKQASELRSSGELLKFGERISCPVVAIHGDYDPHPSEGVTRPLSTTVKKFKYFILNNCGHTPWKERMAKDAFYKILFQELQE